MVCERCGKQTISTVMSWFNTENICRECEKIEEADPRYEEAREADRAACRAGNYNFQGIGWNR